MSISRSPRIAERLLTWLLPGDWRDALIGDLHEEAARTTRIHPLYWREVAVALAGAIRRMLLPTRAKEELMSVTGTATHRPVAFALALGVLGGGALITTAWLTARGPIIFLPYAAIVLAAAFFLRIEAVRPLSRRFLLSLGAFMLATIILYVFIGTVSTRHSGGTLSPKDVQQLVQRGMLPRSAESSDVARRVETTGGLVSISILGHAWRIGFMLLIGSVLSAAVAQLTGTSTPDVTAPSA